MTSLSESARGGQEERKASRTLSAKAPSEQEASRSAKACERLCEPKNPAGRRNREGEQEQRNQSCRRRQSQRTQPGAGTAKASKSKGTSPADAVGSPAKLCH
jgi:hypothetical protein